MQNHRQKLLLIVVISLFLLVACSGNIELTPASMNNPSKNTQGSLNSNQDQKSATPVVPSTTNEPAPQIENTATPPPNTVEPTATPTPDWTSTPDTRLQPYQWRYWPIIPEISAFAKELYLTGIANGNDPSKFSKIGDCQSEPAVFFGIYDIPNFQLSPGNDSLQSTLDQFSGSFGRHSVAVFNGMTVASEFSPLWAHNADCEGNENPLECEFRLHNPSIAIISLGTNWPAGALSDFDNYLRRIVEFSIEEGVLPVIATKADFADEDNSINLTMATIAYDYDIPLWNFWLTVQHLPNHGIDPEQEGGSVYLIPDAWDIKSYSGLQTLDHIWSNLGELID